MERSDRKHCDYRTGFFIPIRLTLWDKYELGKLNAASNLF